MRMLLSNPRVKYNSSVNLLEFAPVVLQMDLHWVLQPLQYSDEPGRAQTGG